MRMVRPRTVIAVLVGLLGLYALAGLFLFPYLIEAYGIPAVAERLRHSVAVRAVAFNPFTLSLRLTGLEVRESDETPILGFEELFVDVRATTLCFQTLGFDEIRLTMPFVVAKVNREGTLNLLALVPPAEEPAGAPPVAQAEGENKKMMPVAIDLLSIDKGILEYRDESKARPVSIDIVPIHILLRNFSTIQGSENAYAFTAEIGKGEAVAWEGTISLQPLESDGKVSLSGVKLETLYQAVQDRFQFDIQQGELKLSALYYFDLHGQEPTVTVNDGRVSVRNLAIGERGLVDPVVAVPVFDIEGIHFDLQRRAVTVEKVHSADARFQSWMDPGGTLNLQTLFTPVAGGSAAALHSPVAKHETPPQPWSVAVDLVTLRNYQARFEDRMLARPSYAEAEALDVTVKEVQIPFKKPLPIELSMKLNQTGLVDLKGQVTVEPIAADLDLVIRQVGIRPFQPYLDRFLDVDVQDGAVDLHGSLRYAREHPKSPLVRFQGNLAVARFSITDRTRFESMLSWKSLEFNRLALDVEPTAVKIAEIVWQEPAVQMVVEPDGRLNFSHLLAGQLSDETPAKKRRDEKQQPSNPAAPVAVTIDQVKLVSAAATYRDLSIEPFVQTGITQLSGTLKGLSSKQVAKADVDLAGKVDNAALVQISGKINPLSEDAFTDLVITLGGMDLTPAGPYSRKYVGYALSKGKLSLDLKYKVAQKLLEAENLVLVDQLTFGEKTDSPDATSLPVPLVVALLQDRQGRIEIDLPIRGDLNDPDFKYGGVVISALLNLLGKVVASPFTLIGKLVPDGGSEEDLQFIQFQPGSATLLPDEVKKLDVLAKALEERQGLRLEVTGTADERLDRDWLRASKLKAQLLAIKQQERGKGKAEQEELPPQDEHRLVEQLFAKLQATQPATAEDQPPVREQSPPTMEEMKQRLLSAIPVARTELEALARQRAEAVRNHLLEQGGLANERVFLLATSMTGANGTGTGATGASPHHDLVPTRLGLSAE
jgi:outer membrane protein OmpA-like peptidoglycan-associated protein